MPPPPEPVPTSVRVPRNEPPPRSLAALLQRKPGAERGRARAWKERAFAVVILAVLVLVVAAYLVR